ncbi:hypothetical protein FGU65_02990 [Methanoculleus sp. FWC-SCC1]|uniref:DUF4352 domain-containing protein n=1 Tax=Methanoculleus frigidifontis TaxID=2584085 RepID=A0ABT8M7G8_9EURY|nr:hypothetical protein [Methanoculleus sp. FWC-SCC1]MDN7023866.1 hypothetical protein [Methanoculleus sp. FWC-SCC1]
MRVHLVSALLIVGILGLSGFLLSASALVVSANATNVSYERDGVALQGMGALPVVGMLSTYLSPEIPVNVSAGTEENLSGPADAGPVGDTIAGNTSVSEMDLDLDAAGTSGEAYGNGFSADERMRSLISDAAMPLMILAVQSMAAERCNDTLGMQTAAAEMHELAAHARTEAASLEVSGELQPTQANFLLALDQYEKAGALLTAENASGVSSALVSIAEGCSSLEVAMQGPGQEALLMQTGSGSAAPVVGMTAPVQKENASKEHLALLERFCYDDPEGENMLSFIAESTGKVHSFTCASGDEKETVAAGNDRQFLLVVVKATNLGHKGNGDLYQVDTPETAAITLHCHDREYLPLDLPAKTSLGESYAGSSLERYASKEGYLVFDVPASLNVSEASLHLDLGQNGAPAWSLAEPTP